MRDPKRPPARLVSVVVVLSASGCVARRAPVVSVARAAPPVVLDLGIRERLLAAGADHTCVIDGDYEVRCWGANTWGQLGDGTTANRTSPVHVRGLRDARALFLARDYSCAVTGDGSAYCWGRNSMRRLGPGPEVVTDARRIPGLATVAALATGDAHLCALLRTGVVRCWGSNVDGELGVLGPRGRTWEHAPTALDGAIQVTAGARHTCALRHDRRVHCWGRNVRGEAGRETGTDIALPGPIADLAPVADVAASERGACVRYVAGGVSCWGDRHAPASERPTGPRRTRVGEMAGVRAIAVGHYHGCAVQSDETAACWGEDRASQTGDRQGATPGAPARVQGLAGVAQFALGAAHSCALTRDGEVMCWGSDARGQLGDGDEALQTQFVRVALRDSMPTLVSSPLHVGARYGDRSMEWLFVIPARLRPAEQTALVHPVAARAPRDVGALSISEGYACGVTDQQTARCWWAGGYSSQPSTMHAPLDVPALTDVVQVAMVPTATLPAGCALVRDGRVYCWTASLPSVTGPAPPRISLPIAVAGVSGADELAVARGLACARTRGTVRCWTPSTFAHSAPSASETSSVAAWEVPRIRDAVQLAAGNTFVCARSVDGSVRCFGDNRPARIGVGSPHTSTPHGVDMALPPVADVVASGDRACARTTEGRVYCWGDGMGPVGAGTGVLREAPVLIPGIEGARSLAVGRDAACAHTHEGIRCWLRDDRVARGELAGRALPRALRW